MYVSGLAWVGLLARLHNNIFLPPPKHKVNASQFVTSHLCTMPVVF